MDLNYILRRRQFALHLAENAISTEALETRHGLADGYETPVKGRRDGNHNRLLCV